MNFVRTISIICTVAAATGGTSVWAAGEGQQDRHHPAASTTTQGAKDNPATPGMGMGMHGSAMMPGYTEQMNAMQAMHDKMLAAKTPEERNALMAEQMTLMQNGMGMMARMGPGGMAGKPGNMTAREGMMERRMDIMQSMMQMTMDRTAPAPTTK